jgi:hypothetical protein
LRDESRRQSARKVPLAGVCRRFVRIHARRLPPRLRCPPPVRPIPAIGTPFKPKVVRPVSIGAAAVNP